jgi:hypothetical protein
MICVPVGGVLRLASARYFGSLMRLLERFPRFHSRRKQRLELEKIASRAAGAEHEEALRERDQVLAERDTYLRQRDEALGERNAYLQQRDIAIGERNEILRQRDEQIGLKNLLNERVARYSHRADVVMRPAAATGDHLLLFLHLAKTGGMTLSDIFARNFATEESLQIDMAETNASALGIWSHSTIEQALRRLQPSEAARLRVVWGHYRHGVQALLPKPCAVVTLLREPLDRFHIRLLLLEWIGRQPGHIGTVPCQTVLRHWVRQCDEQDHKRASDARSDCCTAGCHNTELSHGNRS